MATYIHLCIKGRMHVCICVCTNALIVHLIVPAFVLHPVNQLQDKQTKYTSTNKSPVQTSFHSSSEEPNEEPSEGMYSSNDLIFRQHRVHILLVVDVEHKPETSIGTIVETSTPLAMPEDLVPELLPSGTQLSPIGEKKKKDAQIGCTPKSAGMATATT